MKFLKHILSHILLFPILLFAQSDTAVDERNRTEIPVDPTFQTSLLQILPLSEAEPMVVQQHINSCEKLLRKGLQVPTDLRLDFAIRQMKFQQSMGQNEALLKLVLSNKKLAEFKDTPPNLKNSYDFIAAQTQFLFGDFSSALKSYNSLLTNAQASQDTFYIFKTLYHLGQLYETQEHFSKAEQSYVQASNYAVYNSIDNNLYTQLLETLVEMHFKADQSPKAAQYIRQGIQFANENNEEKQYFLFSLLKGRMALIDNDLSLATSILSEVSAFEILLQNKDLNKKYQLFQAAHLVAERDYKEALKFYESMMSGERSQEKTKVWCTLAQETANLMGNHEMAYEYLLQANVLEKHIQYEKNTQQSYYKQQLKLAEKNNQDEEVLAAQFNNDKKQHFFLYAFGFMTTVCLILCFLLNRQKKRKIKDVAQQLSQKTKELQIQITTLKEAKEEADAFNKILTHDLRGPLRNIISFSTLARKELSANSTTSNYLRYVLKGGKQLRQLITDVAVFQEVNHKAPEPIELIDTNNLMRNLVDAMDVLLEETNAVISFPELPSVVSHHPTLMSVFKHVIENGIKYNKSTTPKIEVQYFRNVDTHFFQFKDNGIGIASIYQASVFELFKRMNGKTFSGGSGLGLNVSQKLLEKLDGKISILESEEGKGSNFQISFPIVEVSEVVIPEEHLVNRLVG